MAQSDKTVRTGNLRSRKSLFIRQIPLLVVFLAPFIVYSVTLAAGFVYDDNVQILTNPWIRDPGKIPRLFVSSTMSFLPGRTANTYRPVFYIVYMAEYMVFGLRAWGWHLVNIILHSLNAVAVFVLASLFMQKDRGLGPGLSRPGRGWAVTSAVAAGLFFGLHPVNSEVASWVGTIPELVFTLMVLTAMVLYILAIDRGKRPGLFLALSLGSFTVGLYSKETAMALIIILPLYEFIRGGIRGCLGRWKVLALYLVPAVIYMVMRTYALGGMTQMSLIKMTPYEGLLNVPALVARYLGKLILPMGLTIIYDFEPVRSALAPLFFAGLMGCAAFAALVYCLRKDRRKVFFLIWILVPLLPVLYMPILSVGGFADRYLYLSTAGFGCFLGISICEMGSRPGNKGLSPSLLTIVLALVLALYAGASVKRGLVWRNDLTLWSDTIKKSPRSPYVLYNLAWTLHKRDLPGDKDRALELYEKALKIRPDKEDAHYNAALIYQERGQYRKALQHFMASLRLKPYYSTTYYNIAMIYQAEGRIADALRFYKGAIIVDPRNEDAHYNLAWLYQDIGDYKNALTHYTEVLRLNPRSVDAHFNMGLIYEAEGRSDLAAREYTKALSIDPGYGPAILGMKRLKHGAS